jgi:DNA polymerase-1
MIYIGVDSETVAFAPGDQAPPLVCVQWQRLDELDQGDASRHLLTRRAGALTVIRGWLLNPEITLVLHNASYDTIVWCREGLTEEVFAAYRAGRILCTWVYERLGEIAGFSTRKKLNLATCCKAHGLEPPAYKDEVELPGRGLVKIAQDFAQFLDEGDITAEPHRTYALDDCIVGKLFQRQYRRFGKDVSLEAVARFSRTAFWLRLSSVWGLRSNGDLVAAFKSDVEAQLAELRERFTLPEPYAAWTLTAARHSAHVQAYAFERARELAAFLRPDGTCMVNDVLLPYIEQAYDGKPPRTPTGLPQRSSMILAESGDPSLEAFAHYGELVKAESSDIPMLEAGYLHPRYGFAETGRTTCSKPNVQNLPGGGPVRACIQAAPGWAFLERDYSGIELCTFAAVAGREVGDWSMADTINAAGDPGYLHAVVGGHLLGCSPEELLRRREAGDDLAENARTRAKNLSFGRIGGLGSKTYVGYVRQLSKGKIILTEEESAELFAVWEVAVPAGPKYLRWVGTTEGADGSYEAHIDGVDIIRRGMWYCAAANCRFQGLAAAIMHEAGWRLAEACYVKGVCPALYGVRLAVFVHDAFVLECPIERLHEADEAFERILREAAHHVMPEVITRSEGHAALNLAKKVNGQKVKRVTDKNGRLIPWTPKPA